MLLSLMLGGASPARTTFATEANEALATLREVVLMPWDIPSVVPTPTIDHDVVVLVHGFFASPGVFRPLRARIERETNALTASFTHTPGMGVRTIARRLAKLVDRIPHHARVHIVGHSLGGVVARFYVQELGGHHRVSQTISLGSPFGGTMVAKAFPFLVGADLHPQSALLARLRATATVGGVPHTSVVAAQDRMVLPRESAILPSSDVITLEGRGHNSLLYDHEVWTHVIDRIRTPLGHAA